MATLDLVLLLSFTCAVCYSLINLLDILPEIHKVKPVLVTKYVYQAALKLLDDSKADMKGAVNKLIQVLHKLTGSAFIEAVPPPKLERVLSIIKT